MISARTGLLAAILAAAWTTSASADTAYSLTETLIGEWLWDNGNTEPADDYYGDIKNRLNVSIQAEGIDVGFRVDTATFRFLYPSWMGDETAEEREERERLYYRRHGIEPDESGEYGHVGDYRLERAYARVRLTDDWTVTGGDFYAHLGRGLVLSLRKEDELGIDSALRGARLDGRVADRVDLVAMAGLANVTNVDERYNLISDDPLDLISAGEVGVEIWSGNRVLLHAVDYRPHADGGEQTDLVAFGGALDFPELPGGLRLYAEADGLHRSFQEDRSDDGFALWGEAGGAWGPVQLRLEYKEYRDFDILSTSEDALGIRWPYNRPPLADQEDQLIESEYDVRGARVRVDYQILDWLAAYVACAGAQDLSEGEHHAVHGYAGLEATWDDGRSSARLSGGYRHAWQPALEEGFETYRTLWHLKFDLGLHLWGPLSLSAMVLHEEWERDDYGTWLEYRRGTTGLSLDWAGVGGVIGTFEYDTEQARWDHWFGSFGLQWFAFDWLTVRAKIGSQRGGLKCLGGVCRQFPPFDGARLEFVFRL